MYRTPHTAFTCNRSGTTEGEATASGDPALVGYIFVSDPCAVEERCPASFVFRPTVGRAQEGRADA